MRTLFTLFSIIYFSAPVASQNLAIQQENGKLFLNHSVVAKENWYSIGRVYNLSPKDIAPFNNTTIEKGLSIGQKLKIPLTNVNFAQSGQPGADEVFVPLYHQVKEKEGLYRIGQNFNKVPTDEIKAWNKLNSDDISNGTNLIVGFLRVKKDLSPLAGNGYSNIPANGIATTQAPASKKASTTPPPAQEKMTPPVTPVAVQDTHKTAANPTPNPSSNPPSNTPVSTTSSSAASGSEGAFGGLYEEQTKGKPHTQVAGQAALFKSTSGWKDGKYYVLMNKTTPGTIVKITLPSSGKVVYAKVLGEIPPGKENEGLLIRISNAATAQLQAPEGRFDVQLQY